MASASQVARPSAAKTFRLGFLPTASRLEALLTRNASRKSMRGCVTCTTNDGPVGSAIYKTHIVSMLSPGVHIKLLTSIAPSGNLSKTSESSNACRCDSLGDTSAASPACV